MATFEASLEKAVDAIKECCSYLRGDSSPPTPDTVWQSRLIDLLDVLISTVDDSEAEEYKGLLVAQRLLRDDVMAQITTCLAQDYARAPDRIVEQLLRTLRCVTYKAVSDEMGTLSTLCLNSALTSDVVSTLRGLLWPPESPTTTRLLAAELVLFMMEELESAATVLWPQSNGLWSSRNGAFEADADPFLRALVADPSPEVRRVCLRVALSLLVAPLGDGGLCNNTCNKAQNRLHRGTASVAPLSIVAAVMEVWKGDGEADLRLTAAFYLQALLNTTSMASDDHRGGRHPPAHDVGLPVRGNAVQCLTAAPQLSNNFLQTAAAKLTDRSVSAAEADAAETLWRLSADEAQLRGEDTFFLCMWEGDHVDRLLACIWAEGAAAVKASPQRQMRIRCARCIATAAAGVSPSFFFTPETRRADAMIGIVAHNGETAGELSPATVHVALATGVMVATNDTFRGMVIDCLLSRPALREPWSLAMSVAFSEPHISKWYNQVPWSAAPEEVWLEVVDVMETVLNEPSEGISGTPRARTIREETLHSIRRADPVAASPLRGGETIVSHSSETSSAPDRSESVDRMRDALTLVIQLSDKHISKVESHSQLHLPDGSSMDISVLRTPSIAHGITARRRVAGHQGDWWAEQDVLLPEDVLSFSIDAAHLGPDAVAGLLKKARQLRIRIKKMLAITPTTSAVGSTRGRRCFLLDMQRTVLPALERLLECLQRDLSALQQSGTVCVAELLLAHADVLLDDGYVNPSNLVQVASLITDKAMGAERCGERCM